MHRIMILAPHPDDEILGCAGLIQKAGLKDCIWVVLATNGDYYGRESAAVRLLESQKALNWLNIEKSHIIPLGFGDTGMAKSASFLNRLYHAEPDAVCPSFVSDIAYHPLPADAGFPNFEGVPYTRNGFKFSLGQAILRSCPDIIYAPSQYDAHGDHCALFFFLQEVLSDLNLDPVVRQYMIHGGDDKVWPPRNTPHFLKPPSCPNNLWKRRMIVSNIDADQKRKLIQIFQSQISPSGYLLSFAKSEEFFLEVCTHAEDKQRGLVRV